MAMVEASKHFSSSLNQIYVILFIIYIYELYLIRSGHVSSSTRINLWTFIFPYTQYGNYIKSVSVSFMLTILCKMWDCNRVQYSTAGHVFTCV